jgi:uncharacterized coiled-coil protein SlyX
MQSKVYKFKDTEFTVQKNVFKVGKAWLPVRLYFEDLIKLYTERCDMSAINSYNERLKELNIKDAQDKSDIEKPNLDSDVIARIQSQIEKNKIELDKITSEFESDVTAKEQQAEYHRMIKYVLEDLVLSYDVIKGFLETYLVGDFSKLDVTDESAIKFVDEVIGDFFLSKNLNRN